MGYNATVVVLLDRLHEIENDPLFGKKLADAIKVHSYPCKQPYITGQTQVVDVQHADTMQIVAVGGNCGRTIGYGNYRDSDKELLKSAAAWQRLEERRRAEKESVA